MADEGFRSEPYLDTEDVPTIGYGTTALLDVPVNLDMPPISQTAARQVLRGDLYQALIDAQAIFAWFDRMDDLRQEVLVNMAYNLGRHRLSNFRKMIRAAKRLDYQTMSDEMQDSKWYGQVGQRSKRLVEQMRTGIA